MSNIVTSLLRSRSLGVGLTGKAILLFMGDLASDDGSGIWAAKSRIARELETTDRTVQRTIERLVDAGFVTETGHRKHRNGWTVEYTIDVDLVAACAKSKPEPPTDRQGSAQHVDAQVQDMTPDTPSPPTHRHPTPDTPSPHGVTHRHPNHPITTDEPHVLPLVVPQGENSMAYSKPSKRATAIPENWVPSDRNIQDAISRNFSEGEIQNEANRFRDYCLANGRAYKDWDAAWRNWLGNARKFAAARHTPVTRAGAASEGLLSGFAGALSERRSRG